ncbi:outer membrane receptor protein involved in Fe transport [Gelidibacter algens]|uniref:Outer membrane receptor protein involved in Fe transport n=1 Tax=Gelidibacter algens TaxID=49280 RepID=A0A1A7R0M9_9FLAO|nr:TonB-dependent receptor [Gelidibacter algens]OBX25073.1 TonB-dependent receptor [Gelidibacter algens]RAJ23009.1 outer membrane receptor protein involved in Fe transport [Gelidibacter algens]
MKKITQFLMMSVAMLCATASFSQSTLKGKVIGSDMNAPLPGANVIEKGTTNGTTTDFDGNFTLKTKTSSGEIIVTYVGYTSMTVSFSGDKDFGSLSLQTSEVGLQEVQIIASVAVDRKTPVAVSTIKSSEIELKLGTQEFPEILKSTPGVYATKTGGGYGDGEIRLRGFNSENVAVMINGVPVNDMENGRVYWSNWAGLGDVTSSMQVQRGLGASKVAVPSVGGTINIISKTTDVEAGGSIDYTLGNDNYKKFGLSYSTGLMENGLAATVSASKTEGDNFVDGTPFTGVSYFVNISKEINNNHRLSLTAFGNKQRHGQRQNSHLIETYRKSERGIKYNSDWGYKQGQLTNTEDNFYHKPQISLNHYWDLSDATSISTALYASFGSGGGGGFSGTNKFGFDNDEYRIGELGTIDFDKIVAENEAAGVNGSESILRASRNDHIWYGAISTLKTDLTDDLVFLGGIDLRGYKGLHFTELTDLLGGQYYLDNSNENSPGNRAQVGDKILYDNDGKVGWLGAFAQVEYDIREDLNAFVSVSASNTSYQRVDRFLYLDSDPLQTSETYNFFGYGVKGGANYRIDDVHNVFANLGYFEKAPYFNSVFANRNNTDVNGDAENQKITSFELGYGYRGDKFNANVNVYHTTWKDRTEFASFRAQDGTRNYANILGVNAVHQGVEIDFSFKATNNLTVTGMASIGDWRWQNNVENVQIFDEENNPVGDPINIFIEDLHVGNAAQTTFALGTNYKISPDTRFTIDYNYFDNLYAEFDPSDRNTVKPDAWEVPAYGIFDTALQHELQFGEFRVTLTGRVNNVFDTEYIADAQDGSNSDAFTSRVFYGFGRTFSVGAKLKF